MGYRIMQIEASNICSLRCVYCPHPSQVRPKGNMTIDTFKKCIELVRRSENPVYKGRKFVFLNHFGEPLLNPLLPEFIAYADSVGVEVSFSTNGVDHDEEFFPRSLWETLARAGLKVVEISTHAKSEEAFRKHLGELVKIRSVWKPRKDYIHDWAGQVKVNGYDANSAEFTGEPCDYELHNMFAITWDGRIAACCYDIEARTDVSVDHVLENGFEFRPISLCTGCRLGRGDAAWISDPLPQALGRTP